MDTDRPLSSVEDLQAARRSMRADFRIEEIPRDDAAEFWSVRDGALQHKTGGFFSVSGFRDPRDGRPRLMLYQPQGAVNGLATKLIDGQRVFLLQARAEPGNEEEVQFGPSLQSTPANWMRLHGGKASPYAARFLNFLPETTNLVETTQLDLGGRYVQKSKRVAIAEVPRGETLDTGFHWVSGEAVVEGVAADYCFNTDLRAALAIAPWSSDPASGELVPRSEPVARSLDAPVRPEVIGTLLGRFQTAERVRLEQVPLEAMPNWAAGPLGFDERTPDQRLSIRFYSVSARAREMATWIQPLVVGQSEGRSILACRERDGMLEVRIAVRPEIGLPNGVALGPTFLAYPGEDTGRAGEMGFDAARRLVCVRESDEGGRFINHRSLCELVLVDDDLPIDATAPGAWLRVSELKLFLGLSNLCSIQLRTISSLLLAA